MADGNIGNVGVEVTPDSRNFWNKFRANTEAQARSAGDDLGRALGIPMGDKAGREARPRIEAQLKGIRATVTVDADTKKAEAKIGLLGTSALALGPALIPIGAAIAASFGAGALGAASLVLGIKGIQAEMKAGTATGKQYSAGVQTLKGYFGQLEKTAATNLLGPFNEGIKDAGGLFPSLNTEVGEFAKIAGTDLALALHGLIGGFQTLEPLFLHLGEGSEHLFTSFDKYANGTGLQKFADYAQANLPKVEATLKDIAGAVVHVVTALAPLGGVALSELQIFADIVKGLDPATIQAIAAGVAAWAVAARALGVAQKLAGFVGGGLSTAGYIGVALALDQVYASATHSRSAVTGLSSALNDVLSGKYGNLATDLNFGAAGVGALNSDKGVSTLSGLPKGAASVGTSSYQSAFNSFASPGAQAAGYATALATASGVLHSSLASAGTSLSGYAQGLDTASTSTKGLLDNVNLLTADNSDSRVRLGGGLEVDTAAYNLALKQTNGNQAAAIKLIQQASTQSPAYQKILADLAAKQAAYSDELSGTSTALGISSDDLSKYAGLIGITGDQVASGAVTQDQLTSRVQGFLDITKTAGPALQGLLSAMDQYSQSTGTAADKTKLLGAILKESQGDALSYSAAIAGGYSATQSLIDTFQQQSKDILPTAGTAGTPGHVDAASVAAGRDRVAAATTRLSQAETKLATARQHQKGSQIPEDTAAVASARAALSSAQSSLAGAKKGTGATKGTAGTPAALAFQDTEKAAINLNTGLINLKAKGAVPLIQQLQGMQDAAVTAATALYQHEQSTKGDTQALTDAQTIFESMTNGALVDNAKQLGLTKDQAKKLADQYFDVPKDLSTTVHSVGLSDINDTLQQIGQLLADITGKPWKIPIQILTDGKVDVKASKALGSLIRTDVSERVARLAGGGEVFGPGTGTSDSVPAWLSNGEVVSTAESVKRNKAALLAGNRGATLMAHYATGGVVGGGMVASPAAGVGVIQLEGDVYLDRNKVGKYMQEWKIQQGRS